MHALRVKGRSAWNLDIFLARRPKTQEVLVVVDAASGEIVGAKAKDQILGHDVVEYMDRLAIDRGVPDEIRTDNGVVFRGSAVQSWIEKRGVRHVSNHVALALRGVERELVLTAERLHVPRSRRAPARFAAPPEKKSAPRTDRVAIGNWARTELADRVRAEGKFSPATPTMPATRELMIGDAWILMAEDVLLLPHDPDLSETLDVWPRKGAPKCLSVSWMPNRPWLPPRVGSFKTGEWVSTLGFTPRTVAR